MIDFNTVIHESKYDFLRNNEHLGNNIILLGLGGSYAYGTNVESSDIDIRGCALNTREEILTNINFEQFVNEETDTTIYSFNKLISLLSNCNPNTIELLGLRPEHYIKLTYVGQELLENKKLFLSQRCIHTFGGYAISQLRRLENISNRYVEQQQREQHILDSINNAQYNFKDRFWPLGDGEIKLYIDNAICEELESEIFMDVNLKHYPLRDYTGCWNEMKSIVSSYNKIGKRNQHALDHKKIGKHMMHLMRLYMMCLDILEKEEIITYREKEHDLLMDIRNGKYLDESEQPTAEFYELVDAYEKKLEYAKKNTNLPEKPNYNKINEFVMEVNEYVVRNKQ